MIISTNLRISQKIMLLVAGLAFGFVVIGIAYFVQMSTEQAIRQQSVELSQNESALAAARIDVVELNRLLVEFVAMRQASSLEQQSRVVADLRQKLDELKAEGTRIGISGDLREIESLLRNYDSAYQEMGAQLLMLGDQAETGLHQEMKTAAERLENALYSTGNATLVSEYLRMRQAEGGIVATIGGAPKAQFDRHAAAFLSELAASNMAEAQKGQLNAALENYTAKVTQVSAVVGQVAAGERQLRETVGQLAGIMSSASQHMREYAGKAAAENAYKSQISMVTFVGLGFAVVMAVAVGVFFIYKSIVFPMAHIQNVIRRINKGNLKARVRLTQKDELGDLGQAFNILLDERIRTLEEQSLENEQLNNSIISLIRALGAIAQKNLTVKVPVSADITGTISDAVNLLTTETAKTLAQVKDISEQVNAISDLLQRQSSAVVRVAEDERKQVMATSKALDMSARAMNEIAVRAGTADNIASKTIADTQQAREAVMRTVRGIQTIRETISETEKRIKRLGDRSQEISGIVNLINTIAERTHILALNASMHAASAGEAGKGFAVVADEVQRLAENAREATAEIASMVNNIRVETSDTVNIMNKLITEVAEGTRLGEQAEKRMEVTEDATRQLVETVQVISHSSVQQAQISNKIRDRANLIRNFTEKTGGELVQQKRHTDSLKHFAEVLLDRVNVFILPEALTAPVLHEPLVADADEDHVTDVVSKKVG
jgi:twitching motility protein PilJ